MTQLNAIINQLLESYPTYLSRKNSPLYLGINVNGNKKLLNTEHSRFIIWSLPAVTTCPYATEHCKKACYALKAERVYPNVKTARNRNFEDSRKADFVARMVFTLETELATKKYHGKQTIVRIHESGDFYNQTYVNAWLQVAKYFEGRKNIVFMAYTKSLVYFIGKDIPSNMVVRSSIWDDTDIENKNRTYDMNLPIYTAVTPGFDFESNGYSKCDCADCANCGKCWDKSITKLACIIH